MIRNLLSLISATSFFTKGMLLALGIVTAIAVLGEPERAPVSNPNISQGR